MQGDCFFLFLTFPSQGGAKKGNTSLSASVEIVCTTCYIKGNATAQFTINGNFNVSQAFRNATTAVESEISNITTAAVDYVENYVANATSLIASDGFSIKDFDFPPLDVDFDVKVLDIPQADLLFQFDGLELYMQIDTILSSGATYTLNLYTSDTPIGFAVANDLLIGVVFSVDLILSVDSEIHISTGFHIQLHDGIAINIPMFNQNVSSIALYVTHLFRDAESCSSLTTCSQQRWQLRVSSRHRSELRRGSHGPPPRRCESWC